MKVTNDGQLNAMFNRKSYNVPFPTDRDTIHDECNKPLQSKWYVSSNAKSKFKWRYHQSSDYVVRSNKAGNMWFVKDKPKKIVSDVVKEQRRLYNKLKRDYEKSLQTDNSIDDDTIITKQDKLQAVTRQRSVKLLNGLAFAPRYDRIYSDM